MSQSHYQLWVHLIWTTKAREPWLKKKYRFKIIEHIRAKGNEKDYHIDIVNGVDDHLHALVAYKATQRISRIVNDIKGCLLYTSPSPRDGLLSRMPSSA